MISKLFDNPTFTKFFSLFVAVLIWLFVGAQNPETETVYPRRGNQGCHPKRAG